jgi:predicted tellurium resistance membrane protein TerC
MLDPTNWVSAVASGWSEMGETAFWVALLKIIWINILLLVPEEPDETEVQAVEHLWRAVRIVAVADIIMSLDNVIAIAAAAQGNMALLVIGLAISIPLIVAGAALIMALLDQFPILVWAGAALLGWIVGEVIATDPAIQGYLEPRLGAEGFHYITLFASLLGAVLVMVVGGLWRRSKVEAQAQNVSAAE